MTFYGHEPPERLKPDAVAALGDCAASHGAGTRSPDGALERWKSVRYALEGVLSSGLDIEDAVRQNTGGLDRVQTDIVRDLVTSGVAILGAEDAVVEFDPDDSPSTVDHPRLNGYFDSWFQIEVTNPTNPENRERLKIKTGATGTSAVEGAVLLEGGDPSVSYGDLMLQTGAIEPIEMEPEDRTRHIEALSVLAESTGGKVDRTPGLYCYRCPRIARCGQFPAPEGYRVRASEWAIWLSKTDLLSLGQCDRRGAWKSFHAIPKEGEDFGTDATATGLLFHEFIAAATMSDDPDGEFARLVDRVAPDEAVKLERLYRAHKTVEASHVGVEVSRVEYMIGMTIPMKGPVPGSKGTIRTDGPLLVVIIARADGVGREADGTPAVIEHRTGKSSDRIDERETALYAVSTARLLGVDTVAVHQHALGAQGGPKCERIVYDADRLTEADALLKQSIARVADWHPLDAAAPAFSVGEWCTTCRYEERCKRYR